TRFGTSGESRATAAVWAGAGAPPHWSGGARPADFYDVKGVIEAVANAFGAAAEFEAAEVPYLLPGKSAAVTFRVKADTTTSRPVSGSHPAGSALRRNTHGVVGQITPAIAEARGFPAHEPLWVFELDADALGSADAADDLRAESLPRFPSIQRDVS